ncbi:MAG: putative metalloprotease, partial [Modestobacter sp.]|nr:putative metalloprotease [Modestobacter sp.]
HGGTTRSHRRGLVGRPTGSTDLHHSLTETSRPRLSSREREHLPGGSPGARPEEAAATAREDGAGPVRDLGRRHGSRSGGYSRAVYQRLLTWRWVLMHLLVLALFVATFFLGHWQLSKAEDGGGAVNWSYALQWPLYGFMGLGFYLRMVRDELHRDPADDEPGNAVVLYQRPRIDTTGDPELAAYNAYLAELNEKALGQRVNGGR